MNKLYYIYLSFSILENERVDKKLKKLILLKKKKTIVAGLYKIFS